MNSHSIDQSISGTNHDEVQNNKSFYRKTANIFINYTYSHYISPIKTKRAISSDNGCKVPTQYPMLMSSPEKDLLKKYISISKEYLEFGSGGSTFFILENSPSAKVTSVESDAGWIEVMRKWNYIREAENSRLKIHIVNIGSTGQFGTPLEINKKQLFPSYSSSVFSQINPDSLDTVLVDGRFRVACILQTILHCQKNVTVLVHDFTNRPYYHAVLNFLDVIECADSLAVLKIKPDVNLEKVRECYEYFKFNWQ